MAQPEIQGWQMQPPAGGWRISVLIKGESFIFSKGGPQQIVEEIATLQKKNGIFEGYDKIWKYCNDAWCYKDPKRCTRSMTPEQRKSAYKPEGVKGMSHASPSPTQYGARLWEWLNTFGMKGCFDKADWTAATKRIGIILNPKTAPATGCAICYNEWMSICTKTPPSRVNTDAEAARWVFEAHNKVNKKIRKPAQEWGNMVRKNHWNVPV